MEAEMMLESWGQQLEDLYAEREMLANELGVSNVEDAVAMVRNLEAQLHDMYQTHGSRAPVGDAHLSHLLQYVEELSGSLDSMYSEKMITVELDGDRPIVKATWKETANQGDTQ